MFAFRRSQSQRQTYPFSTQFETLNRYNRGYNERGEFIGACNAMTNAYLMRILNRKDPTPLLADDALFLIASIELENKQLEAGDAGDKDPTHYAFTETKTPHKDITLSNKEEFTKEFDSLLKEHDQLLIEYPPVNTAPPLRHLIYFGRDPSNHLNCRFFDANLRGGERKKPCSTLTKEFLDSFQSQCKPQETIKIGAGDSRKTPGNRG